MFTLLKDYTNSLLVSLIRKATESLEGFSQEGDENWKERVQEKISKLLHDVANRIRQRKTNRCTRRSHMINWFRGLGKSREIRTGLTDDVVKYLLSLRQMTELLLEPSSSALNIPPTGYFLALLSSPPSF